MEALMLLAYPLLGCFILVLIHAYFGIHVLERGIIFVDLCLAQLTALGIAIASLAGQEGPVAMLCSLACAAAGATILSFSRQIAKHVNIEAFIGVLYVFALSASIVVLDRTPHGMEELKGILNGNILWLTGTDVLRAAVLYALVAILHVVFRNRFLDLTFHGKGGIIWEFLFFCSFSAVLVSSVRMAGILQVFSFLLLPALIGRLFTRRPVKILIVGWVLGIAASVGGILLSYKLDFPAGPLIVTSLCLTFFGCLAVRWGIFREGGPETPGKASPRPRRTNP